MKKVILILGIAATLTSCQKDELEGFSVAPTNTTTDITLEVKQLTEAYGLWGVESMSSFSGDELPQTIDKIFINGDKIYTTSIVGNSTETTVETFYIEFNQLHAETDRLIVSISDTGELTIIYTIRRVILKASRF